ncbi:Mor transcription activator family protein [Lapidilactobacillus wuchangensis]|uniref:Mor transcription activator family protein n=1 Tax=Lapidilactobacillus wuchangensis TaxID=2486001 RepID=UPI000F777D81|nr:Mor transcription activator family protein [Lapidilactobacillus wuchangensis]
MQDDIDVSALHPTYQQLYDLVGKETMLQLYDELKGQQVSFPMRLYDSNKVEQIVQREYNGANLKELTQKYGYSQRWMKRLIKNDNGGKEA